MHASRIDVDLFAYVRRASNIALASLRHRTSDQVRRFTMSAMLLPAAYIEE